MELQLKHGVIYLKQMLRGNLLYQCCLRKQLQSILKRQMGGEEGMEKLR